MKGCGKSGELLTAQNANENSMWRDSSLEFVDFSSLECLLQTTPPVSASNVSKAKGFRLGDLRLLFARNLRVRPREGKRMEGKRKVGRGASWSFWLIKGGTTWPLAWI